VDIKTLLFFTASKGVITNEIYATNNYYVIVNLLNILTISFAEGQSFTTTIMYAKNYKNY
jgi:hypothetical protein